MKVLIMSCDTGEGHNSAARALVGAFNRRNIDCTLIDPLVFRGAKQVKLSLLPTRNAEKSAGVVRDYL